MGKIRKKMISSIAVACVFIVALCIGANTNITKSNEEQNMFLSNVTALAQSEGGSSTSWECTNWSSDCWWIGCSHVDRCGNPCKDVKADNFDLNNKCYSK